MVPQDIGLSARPKRMVMGRVPVRDIVAFVVVEGPLAVVGAIHWSVWLTIPLVIVVGVLLILGLHRAEARYHEWHTDRIAKLIAEVGSLRLENAQLGKTISDLTRPVLLDIHVEIGDAILEDGPKEYSSDFADHGYLLVLRDVSITNRSDIDMTLDYWVDLHLRSEPSRHPGSSYVRMQPLKQPGSIVHRGYLEIQARKTRTITIGLLLSILGASAAGGTSNVANVGHMLWFSDRVSQRKAMKDFYLIRLGHDVQ